MRLKDKVAIITGGASGIGLAACRRFVEEGAKVVLSDYDAEKGKEEAKKLQDEGYDVQFVQVDVANMKSVRELMDCTLNMYGRIDVLVNNAGITQDATLLKMTEEQFDRVIDVNLKGVFYCTKAVAPIMVEQGKGKIINTSSVVGVYGNFGQTNYAASKSAVIGMTKTWAKELGRKGINVNAVAPGFIATPMVQKMPEKVLEKMKGNVSLARLGDPKDVANAYLFLASD